MADAARRGDPGATSATSGSDPAESSAGGRSARTGRYSKNAAVRANRVMTAEKAAPRAKGRPRIKGNPRGVPGVITSEVTGTPVEPGPSTGTARPAPETPAEHEEAVQRARSSAARSLIAVNDRLGRRTDAATYKLAGVDPDAPRPSEPGLLRRLAHAVRDR